MIASNSMLRAQRVDSIIQRSTSRPAENNRRGQPFESNGVRVENSQNAARAQPSGTACKILNADGEFVRSSDAAEVARVRSDYAWPRFLLPAFRARFERRSAGSFPTMRIHVNYVFGE